jgi:hypothetical protein
MIGKKKKKVKFIPCDEFKQTYNWQRTMKRSSFSPSGKLHKEPLAPSRKEQEKAEYWAKRKRSEFVKKWAKKYLKLKP